MTATDIDLDLIRNYEDVDLVTQARIRAKHAALRLKATLSLDPINTPRIGIVLGTGWNNVTNSLVNERSVDLESLPFFAALLKGTPKIPGHARRVMTGMLANQPVMLLNGRVHMNEGGQAISNAVRLQIEMFCELGVTTFILTNGAGALNDPATPSSEQRNVGDLMVHNGFITLWMPSPLCGGEFCSPEDTLNEELQRRALSAGERAGFKMHSGIYAAVRGPRFEGRKADKRVLRNAGAHAIGMSTIPEADVIAARTTETYQPRVVAVSLYTNGDTEPHSHEENQRRAKEKGASLATFLETLVASLPESSATPLNA